MNTVIFGHVPNKTQCGKTGAANEGFIISLENDIFTRKYSADKFWTTWGWMPSSLGQISYTQINPYKPLCQSVWFSAQSQSWTPWICVETAWGLCAVASSYLQWPTSALRPWYRSPLTSSYFCNFSPCNSPAKIEFYIRMDLLRVMSVCPTYFPSDPQAFFYNLPVGEPTAQIKSLINGWD